MGPPFLTEMESPYHSPPSRRGVQGIYRVLSTATPKFRTFFSPQKEARAHQHPDMHDLPSASVDSPVPDGSFKWNHTQWPFGI